VAGGADEARLQGRAGMGVINCFLTSIDPNQMLSIFIIETVHVMYCFQLALLKFQPFLFKSALLSDSL
jgi:hypothetical protein